MRVKRVGWLRIGTSTGSITLCALFNLHHTRRYQESEGVVLNTFILSCKVLKIIAIFKPMAEINCNAKKCYRRIAANSNKNKIKNMIGFLLKISQTFPAGFWTHDRVSIYCSSIYHIYTLSRKCLLKVIQSSNTIYCFLCYIFNE